MIDEKLAEKYLLPPIKDYPFGEHDWYWTFLAQSEKDALAAIENSILGAKGDDYTEVLKARQEARQRINEIDEEVET